MRRGQRRGPGSPSGAAPWRAAHRPLVPEPPCVHTVSPNLELRAKRPGRAPDHAEPATQEPDLRYDEATSVMASTRPFPGEEEVRAATPVCEPRAQALPGRARERPLPGLDSLGVGLCGEGSQWAGPESSQDSGITWAPLFQNWGTHPKTKHSVFGGAGVWWATGWALEDRDP